MYSLNDIIRSINSIQMRQAGTATKAARPLGRGSQPGHKGTQIIYVHSKTTSHKSITYLILYNIYDATESHIATSRLYSRI